jgi:hypothetical protein
MFEVLVLNIADVQKPVASDAKIDERCLDTGFNVNDATLVDITDAAFEAVSFDVKFFKDAVLNNANPALFRLANVDQHFFLHGIP